MGHRLVPAGGIWADLAHHLPLVYTITLSQRVAMPALVRNAGMSRSNGAFPQVSDSVIGLALYAATLLSATLLVVRARDVIA